jgi:F-type H+-transporting ATPase subunit b
MEGFTVNLIPDLVNFGLQIVATIILFLVIKHYLWKPMTKLIESRQELISNELTDASHAKKSADRDLVHAQKKLQEARREADEIVTLAKRRADKVREEIISDAHQAAHKEVEQAKADIEFERKQVQDEMKRQIIDVAIMVAEKVVSEEINEEKHGALINEFIDEVSSGDKWKS